MSDPRAKHEAIREAAVEWAGICPKHREVLLHIGSTVLIDGEHHVLIPGQGGGKVRPKAEVDA